MTTDFKQIAEMMEIDEETAKRLVKDGFNPDAFSGGMDSIISKELGADDALKILSKHGVVTPDGDKRL